MSKEQFTLLNESGKKRASNSGKHLILFNDKSGSMSGGPFNTLIEGCLQLSDSLFPEDGEKAFESVDVCFYDNNTSIKYPKSRDEYIKIIKNEKIGGSTNFSACFDYINKKVKECQDGDEISMVFFTDGEDTCSNNIA